MKILFSILIILLCGCSFADPAPIEEKPWFLDDTPKTVLVTFMGIVYVDKDLLYKYTANPLLDSSRATLEHEWTHARRQHNQWMLIWHLRYLLSSEFRWQEESAAYKAELDFWKNKGWNIRLFRENFIIAVTREYYKNMVTEKEAGEWFDKNYPEGAK